MNKNIIEELHQNSLKKEAQFFQQIADRLGRNRLYTPPARTIKGVPNFWSEYDLDEEERIALFMKNWETLGGVAKRFRKKEELGHFVRDIVETMKAKHVIRANHPFFDETMMDQTLSACDVTVWKKDQPTNLLEKAAGADIGIAVVDYAISHTGSLVVTSGADKGRSLSLLPTVFMGVVPAKNIKTKMGDVLKEVKKWGKMPAGIHFISGPSRSADIENDLTIGVHGPGIVYALIVDEIE